jgi:hypothetical protein
MDAPIFGLPYEQFLIHKDSSESFSFVDFTGQYNNISLRDQLNQMELFKRRLSDSVGWAKKCVNRVRRILSRYTK